MLIILTCAAWGIIPVAINRFQNKVGSLLSILGGLSPLIFIGMLEGQIPLPNHDLSAWIIWPFLGLSSPLFICSALAFAKDKFQKASNASFIGSLIGALVSLYTWSLLTGSA